MLLTKSRSAYLGLAAALAVLAWRERRRVSARRLAAGAIAGLVVVSALVAAGVATGRLDRQVLTESTKSLGYRAEYWIGAWGVITDGPRTWLTGHGPGNFSGPYVRHKLARSSEEIIDPHNLVLEVWAASGVVAALALVAALGLALRETLGPARSPEESPAPERRKGRRSPADPEIGRRAGIGRAAEATGLAGGLRGRGLARWPRSWGLSIPFAGDLFFRWVILGAAWAGAVALGLPLWRRRPIAASGLGAAVLGVSINLLAAGGIGIPAVALALWTAVALGLNLREDRDCGRLRVAGGRLLAFVLALGWAALIGTFVGTVRPYWEVEAAMAEVEHAMTSRPPDPVPPSGRSNDAIRADRFSARPWVALAEIQYAAWRARGARADDLRWRTVPYRPAQGRQPAPQPHRGRSIAAAPHGSRDLLEQLGPQPRADRPAPAPRRRRPRHPDRLASLPDQRHPPRRARRGQRRHRHDPRRRARGPRGAPARPAHAPPRQEAARPRPQAARGAAPRLGEIGPRRRALAGPLNGPDDFRAARLPGLPRRKSVGGQVGQRWVSGLLAHGIQPSGESGVLLPSPPGRRWPVRPDEGSRPRHGHVFGGVDREAESPHPPLRGTFSRGEKVNTLRIAGDALGNHDNVTSNPSSPSFSSLIPTSSGVRRTSRRRGSNLP